MREREEVKEDNQIRRSWREVDAYLGWRDGCGWMDGRGREEGCEER